MLQENRNLNKSSKFMFRFYSSLHNSLTRIVIQSETDWKGKVLNCCTTSYVCVNV